MTMSLLPFDSPEVDLARKVGERAAPFAAEHDREASFVEEGYGAARELGYAMLAVPEEFGGRGADLRTLCAAQVELAKHCASTALAIGMHQHVVLSWADRWRNGVESFGPILQRVALEGAIVALSGIIDLASVEAAAKGVSGGFVVRGTKRFCSGCVGADYLMTAAAERTEDRSTVIGVLVPLGAPGVLISGDCDLMGMRGSASNDVELDDVFVPDELVLWRNVVPLSPGDVGSGGANALRGHSGPARGRARRANLSDALSVISATYLGVAIEAHDHALAALRGTPRAQQAVSKRLMGLMDHELKVARWSLLGLLDELKSGLEGGEAFMSVLQAKRRVVLSSVAVCELAAEAVGSRAYRRGAPIERAIRDARAGLTHPLNPEATLLECGSIQLGF